MADGWSTVAQMLGLKQQREQAQRDRISQALGGIGSMLYGSRQAGKERAGRLEEIEARGLEERSVEDARFFHETQMADIGARHAGALTEQQGGIAAEAATTASGRAITASDVLYERNVGRDQTAYERSLELKGIEFSNTEQLNIQQAELQREANELVFAHDEAMRKLTDEDARAREQNRFENEMSLIATRYENEWGNFEVPLIVHDPTDPAVEYTVNSRPDFEILMSSLEEKSRMAAVRLEAQLRIDDRVKNEAWFGFAQEVKAALLNPSVLNELTNTWVGPIVTSPEEWEEMFRNAFSGTGTWTQGQIDDAARYFMRFVNTAEEAPDASSEGDNGERPPGTRWSFAPTGEPILPAQDVPEPVAEGSPVTEFVAGTPVTIAAPAEPEYIFIGGAPYRNPNYRAGTDIPSGITPGEESAWMGLRDLLSGASLDSEERQEVVQLQSRLAEEGESDAELMKTIMDFLGLFESPGAPQSAAPQDETFSMVQNMLRRV